MDKFSKETRSKIMSKIKSKSTKMELTVKPVLEALGFEHQPDGMFGNPDFIHRETKVALFLDGCFFHGCLEHYREPKSNTAFWKDKLAANRLRDYGVTMRLTGLNWRVIRVWEHDLRELTKKERKREKTEENETLG